MKQTLIFGIYEIVHHASGRRYIGQAAGTKRWSQHLTMLKHNKHHCAELQALWNVDGRQGFAFRMVEEIKQRDARLLTGREQYFIKKTPHRMLLNSVRVTKYAIEYSHEKLGHAPEGFVSKAEYLERRRKFNADLQEWILAHPQPEPLPLDSGMILHRRAAEARSVAAENSKINVLLEASDAKREQKRRAMAAFDYVMRELHARGHTMLTILAHHKAWAAAKRARQAT